MRDFNCAYTFFNAGLLAIVDAIGLPAFPKPALRRAVSTSPFYRGFGGVSWSLMPRGLVLQGWFVGRNVGQVLIRAASQ
jgi:hypothetical protein